MDVTILNPIAATPHLSVASLLRPSVPRVSPSPEALREVNIVELAGALAELGHRVQVVLGAPYLGGDAVVLSDRLSVVPVDTVMPFPFHPGLFPMTPGLLRLPALREADVVQSSEFHQPSTFFAAEACLDRPAPLVVWQETFGPMRFPGSVYQRCFEATAGEKIRAAATRCVPRTSKARGYLRRLGVPDESIPGWVPTGVDLTAFHPRTPAVEPRTYGWEDGCEILLLVARLDPSKGVDVALRLLRGLREDRPKARLLIRGSGPAEADLRRLAEDLHLSPYVRFLPRLDRREMADLYNLAAVVLGTSRNDLLPFSLIEASACARPIVATDVGAVTDIVVDGETGRVVPLGDEAALADAVRALLTDADAAAALGRAGRARAEAHMDVKVCARRLAEVYHAAA